MNVSSRHRYIPQFHIKGFTDKDGLLYIYDKTKGQIREERASPKSIFFEWERNTVKEGSFQSSIIEGYFFKKVDSDCAKAFNTLRNRYDNGDLLTDENKGLLDFFTISLFWRIPKTDYAFNQLFNESTITFYNVDSNDKIFDPEMEKKYKLSEAQKKVSRSRMAWDVINRICTERNHKGKRFLKLFTFDSDCILLGDYPILYEKTPSTFDDIISLDYLLPISSKRIYASEKLSGLNLGLSHIRKYNALVIDQSVKYVCSPNLDQLKADVEYYMELKKRGLVYILPKIIFDRNK